MRILINSDILFTSKLVTSRLPASFESLAAECARVGAIIVLPRTTLLEVERRQQELVDDSVAKVEGAYAALRNAGVSFEERNAAEIFALPDLVRLFRDLGVRVEIEEPTLQDFAEAHRRACLHLSPQAPDTKSDEMRDLVIWVMALRVAARDVGAILLSRDNVHTHQRGDDEAASVQLQRLRDIDQALEYLGVESPTGKLVRLLLEPIWEDLRNAGLPLSQALNIRAVKNAAFVQGEAGIERATFDLKADAKNGSGLTARVSLSRVGETITRAEFRNIKVDDGIWQGGAFKIAPDKSVHLPPSTIDEPLDALREVIGE